MFIAGFYTLHTVHVYRRMLHKTNIWRYVKTFIKNIVDIYSKTLYSLVLTHE